jgi:hypothetical protein
MILALFWRDVSFFDDYFIGAGETFAFLQKNKVEM